MFVDHKNKDLAQSFLTKSHYRHFLLGRSYKLIANLVSASASSGKTTVLVERVLKRILSGTPVSSLLIITFTKAAAREMKERIKQKISDQIEKEPNNQFLRSQLLDVDTANISTIDSFCLDVIRRFYYVIDLDPQFSVLTDETQAELLKERALHEIEIEYLEKNDQKRRNWCTR